MSITDCGRHVGTAMVRSKLSYRFIVLELVTINMHMTPRDPLSP